MGAGPEPPAWAAQYALLEGALTLYAFLLAVAVAATLCSRPALAELPASLKLLGVDVGALFARARKAFDDAVERWRQFVAEFAERGIDVMFIFVLVRIFLSTLVCVLYVYVTYLAHIPRGIRVFQALLGIVLLARLLVKVVLDPNPIPYVVHLEVIMEALSLSSLIIASGDVWLHWSFLQAYIVLARYFHVEPVFEKMLVRKTSPFRRQLARLTLEFIVFMYVFACGLQLFEVMGDPTVSLTRTTFELTLANSLYFTVVTIFTVGYGDFVPYTLLGRLWIIFIIVFGAYLVSRKIGQVIDVVVGLRGGMGAFVKDDSVDHCVLCGNIKWEYLKTFVQEFFADDLVRATKIVVMCEHPNWTEDLWNSFFSTQAQARDNVVYLEGACVTRDDMLRAQVDTAVAVFILNNQHNPEPYMEDSETLKRILSIRGFAPDTPIYSMCALRDSMVQITDALEQPDDPDAGFPDFSQSLDSVSPGANHGTTGFQRSTAHDRRVYRPTVESGDGWSSAHLAGEGGIGFSGDGLGSGAAGGGQSNRIRRTISDEFSDDDDDLMDVDYEASEPKSDAICMQEVEMSLLAENVFCNGLSTLLSNLVLNVVPQSKPDDRPWMVEYKIGAECRLAYVQLPREVTGKRFSEIAITLYDHGILLLALKRFSDVKWRTITPDTVIHPNTIGLVVTFHTEAFIGRVMVHAASFISAQEEFSGDESDMDGSSRGVPSSAEEDFTPAFTRMVSSREQSSVPAQPTAPVRTPGGIRGSVAEGARVSDAESASELTGARSMPSMIGQAPSQDRRDPFVNGSPAGPHEPWSPVAASPASHADLPSEVSRKAVPVAGGPSDTVDELDALADKYVAELDVRAPVAPGGARAASSVPPDDGKRGPAAGLAAALDVTPTPGTADGRQARLGREGSKVSFPEGADSSRSQRSRGKRSFTGGDASGKDSSSRGRSSFSSRGRPKFSSRDLPRIIYGDEALPVRLKGHIVVCVIGQMGLVNLRAFLDRVWLRRREFRRETPVVAICPKITDEIEDDVALFRKYQLFVIHGNSLCVNTLTRARFDRARAIVVLACEDKNNVDHMDAKALFTIMTLDYRLGEQSNTFVCTMIDAEESMQLLRAPTHPRRRGVVLGRLGTLHSTYGRSFRSPAIGEQNPSNEIGAHSGIGDNRIEAEGSTPMPDLSRDRTGDVNRGFGNETGTASALDVSLASAPGDVLRREFMPRGRGVPGSMSYAEGLRIRHDPAARLAPFVGSLTNQWSNRSAALQRLVSRSSENLQGLDGGSRWHSSANLLSSQTRSMLNRGSFERDRNNNMGSSASLAATSAMNFLIHSEPSASALGGADVMQPTFGQAPSPLSNALAGGQNGNSGTRQAGREASGTSAVGVYKRNELFEKQRYASGEMMVSSMFVALLVREFAMPGMMSVVRKIFGVGVGKNHVSKKCWVRTTKICRSWIEAGEGGQRTYRELFEVLLELQCVPLGLYRSGEAMVRVQLVQDDDVGGLGIGVGFGSAFQSNAFERDVNVSADVGFNEASPLLSGPRPGNDATSQPPPALSYTCPTTGRFARYEEVASGDNVLPYVYTNPEPYTLLSEHDAVYILAHPSLKIPDEW